MPIKHLSNAGITMVETIIMVMVMSIMIGIAIPPIALYVKDYKTSLEQVDLLKIQDAMKVFANNYNRLPDDTTAANNSYCNTPNNTWNECLALYSSLSSKQIATDIWGYPRSYVTHVEQEEILGENIDVHYASVYSYGANHNAESVDKSGAIVNGVAVNPITREFEPAGHINWWKNDADPIAEFVSLTSGGDDQFIKFSDLMYKVEKLHRTNNKLEIIADALENYSAVHKERLSIATNTANNQVVFIDEAVYVPPTTSSTADLAHYADAIITDMTTYSVTGSGNVYRVLRTDCNLADCTAEISGVNLGSKCSVGVTPTNCTIATEVIAPASNVRLSNTDITPANKQQRLVDMIKLVRILGLPDNYCCSDLEKEPDAVNPADSTQGRPFFYYSNPRPIVGNVCQARPTRADVMPPVIQATPRTTQNGTACD